MRQGARAARLVLIALFVGGALCACAAQNACGSERFGDSTWIAPGGPFESDSTTDGPRVAPRDHERGWETALRAPFRLAFFPLRLVAGGLEAGAKYVGPRYFEPKASRPPKTGPRLSPSFSFRAVNDIGIGPAVTWDGFPAAGTTFRLAGSWSAIDRRRVRFSETIGYRRPVGFLLRADYDYKPNRRYYGIGNDTPKSDLGYFLLATTHTEAALLVGASPLRQLRIVGAYSSMTPGRGYHGSPLLEDVFAPGSVPFEHRTTQELSYGVTGDLATLDNERDPTLGVHGRFEFRRATGVRSSDPDYNQWRVEGRAYVPVFAKRRVLVVRGVYSGVDPGGDSTTVLPFYRLAQSEDLSRFAGYASGRFRDRQLMLARIEYRWTILYWISALALYELAEVAPRTESFTLRGAHKSYGGGLRIGLNDETTLRFDLAKSVEGLHAVLALGSDF